MESIARIGKGGRLVIPASIRKRMGMAEGDEVILRLEEDELHVTTPAQAARQAQALVRKYVPAGTSLVEELISERRSEASDE